MAIEHLLSVADYLDYVAHLPPDAPVPELMNGRFVVAARPALRHARFQRDVLTAIAAFIHNHQLPGEILPEVEVVLDDFSIVVPDLAYCSATNPAQRLTDERIYGPPEVIGEIASPSTRLYDLQEKFLAYLRVGVQEYWVIDPYRPAGDRFWIYSRIEHDPDSQMPTFRRLEGGPSASRFFAGIVFDPSLV